MHDLKTRKLLRSQILGGLVTSEIRFMTCSDAPSSGTGPVPSTHDSPDGHSFQP